MGAKYSVETVGASPAEDSLLPFFSFLADFSPMMNKQYSMNRSILKITNGGGGTNSVA